MAYKYVTIAEEMKYEILAGTYKPGERLPSIQRLRLNTGCNSDTAVKAYKLLEEEHFIYAVPKSGYFVVKAAPNLSVKNRDIDMNTVRPPDKLNPYKDFIHCMEQAVSLYENKLFEYTSSKGMPELIQVIVKHLMGFQIFTRAEDVFVTNGAQQALFLMTAMTWPDGGRTPGRKKILVEQPTYPVMLQAANCARIPLAGICRTGKGIDLDELEGLFRKGDLRFFYTMPRFQNPTGFSYRNEQKRDIAKLGEKYGVYIVEDDYLADLELDPKADPLYAMGDRDWMIHIRSFSKTLLPGLRLGMCILPERLQDGFLACRRSVDLSSPVITQGALEIFLKSRMYPVHVQRIKKHYRYKMEVLRSVCSDLQETAGRWHIPATGLYAYLELGSVSAAMLAQRLAAQGVILSTTEGCYMEGMPHREGLRLCVCNADDEELRRAAERIEKELEELQRWKSRK